MKNSVLLFCVLLGCFSLNANDFKCKTTIDSVSHDGFYKIQLSPLVISRAQGNGSDLRLFDTKHTEIPYLFVCEKVVTAQTGFITCKILENSYLPKKAITRVVVHNPNRTTLSSFVLQIRNTDIEKEITLKGSDNQTDWFIIKQAFPVRSSISGDKTSELRIFDFPASNYEFFEITLNDKRKDPLQILSVGYYGSETNHGKYTAITSPSVHQSDSAKLKKSSIKLTFDHEYVVDQILLTVTGPDFYMRNCRIGFVKTEKEKAVFETITSFVIASGRPTELNVNGLKAKEWVIEIENADNPPLQITQANAFQLSRYIIANLKAGEKYELYFDNEKINAPNYDLQYFTDKIPGNVPVIKTGTIDAITISSETPMKTFFTKTYIWIALALVIGLLTWLTVKITREMQQGKR